MLDRATRLGFSFCLEICGRRLLCGIKKSQVSALSVIAFAFSHVFFGIAVKAYAEVSSFVVRLSGFQILRVCLLSNATKIFVSVVASIAVNMVNILRRPSPRHEQNGAPMGVVFSPRNRDFSISVWLNPAGNISRFCGSVVHKSCELSGQWIVVKKTTKLLCCKIASSHDALQMLIGQRPQAIRSRLGLRHFSEGV